MGKNLGTLLFPVLLGAVLLGGCESRERRGVSEGPPMTSAPAVAGSAHRRGLPLEITPEIRASWSAVKISVIDKELGNEILYTIPIGSYVELDKSDLHLRVEAFFPSFVMTGTVLTSTSNNLDNPAALILVESSGSEVFRGWIFSLYPAAHAFEHPRFSFVLADFVPGEKKVLTVEGK